MPEDIQMYVFPLLFLGALTMLSFRLRRGVLTLKAQGRSIRPKLPPDALFGESGASGNSERSFITRIGGASRVLLVWVTNRELVVEHIFPFNVFMFEDPYDLEHRVPIQSITAVEVGAINSVFVSFTDAENQPHKLRLYLRQPKAFIATLESLGAPSRE